MSKDLCYTLILTILFEKSSIFFKNKEILRKTSRAMLVGLKARLDNQLGASNGE